VSNPPAGKRPSRLPKPANDNESLSGNLRAEVLIPKDLPITQTEVEVFAFLLDDWAGIPANDNGGGE
jgi:hypothetical protein